MAPTGKFHEDLNELAENKMHIRPTMTKNMELIRNLGSRLRPLFLNDIGFPPVNDKLTLSNY